MQHTLIPDRERAALRREYRTRIFIVLCFALSVAGIVGSGALFPAFVSALQEEKEQLSVIANLKKDKDRSGIGEIEKDLSRDAGYVASLAPLLDAPKHSEIIEKVVRARGNVRITMISLDQSATTTMSIRVQGIAPTRDSLVSFKSRLEQLASGNTVELPISELAKSKDILFTLKVMHALP